MQTVNVRVIQNPVFRVRVYGGGGSGTPGSGTVTSVGLALPTAIFDVSGSPVTTAGTLTATLDTQTANTILSGPATAPAAAPTFRALVEADIPTLPQSKITNLVTDLSGKQPLDSDLTAIAGLTPTNDDFLQRKTGAWTNRTVAQVKTDLGLTGTNTGDQTITLTGDVTGTGTGSFAATIAANAVTFAKMQAVSANILLGNDATGTAIEEITCTAAGRALLDDADATAQRTTLGLGTLATQNGTFSGTSSGTNTGDQTITLTGDVTGTGTGSFAATIANDAVTYAKIQNITASRLLGRYAGTTGDAQEISIGSGLSLDSGTGVLSATGGGGGGGEANTASNVGAGGVGLWKQKSGVDLQFKNINAGSNKVTITDDTTDSEVDIDVVPANFTGIPQSGVTNLVSDLAGKQPLDSDLTDIAALSPSNDDFLQRKAGAWTNRTVAQVKTDLSLTGTNSGDQTITLTGDVTGSGTGSFAATIASGAVTFAKMQAVSASILLGNDATGTAVQEITLGATLAFSSAVLQTAAITGDVTASANSFATTLATNIVSNAKFRQSAGLSVVGRSANTTGDVADISGTDGQVLRVSGTTLGFGAVAQSSVTNLTTDLAAKAANGANTDITSVYLNNTGLKLKDTNASHGLIIAPGSNITADRTLTVTTGDADRTLTLSGNTTLSGTNTGDQTITLTGDVTGSGTGSFAATIAANAVTFAKMQAVSASILLGNDATGTAVQEITLGATLAFSSAVLQTAAITGDVTASANSFATTLATNIVSNAKFRQSAGLSIVGRSANTTGDVADITAANDGEVLRRSGTSIGFGTVATAGIADDAVTFAKIQNVTQARLLGRYTASTGDVQEITLGSGLSLNASTGELTAPASGATDLAFTGSSSPVTLTSSTGNDVTFTAGTNITLSATGTDITINATGGGSSPNVISPSQITSTQNDYNPTGWADSTVVRLSFDASGWGITGFDPETDGEEKTLVNITDKWAYIPAENAGSTAAYRVAGDQDYILGPYGSMRIAYDDTTDRWRVTYNSFNIADVGFNGMGQYYYMIPGTTNQSDHPFLGLAQASGGNGNTPPTTALPGSWDINTAASATGGSSVYILKNNNGYSAFGAAHLGAFAWVYIPTLSTSGQRFQATISLTASPQTVNANNVNNSIGVRYDDNVNTGKWQVFSRDNAGAETTADTGITVATNTLYTIRMWLNKARSEARFYVTDGTTTYQGRITANMPSAAVCGLRALILKSIGTTSRIFNIAAVGAWSIQS